MEKRAKNHFNSLLCHKNIPLHCFCCIDRVGMDSIDHIFNTRKVWSSFASSTGFQPDHSSLQQLLHQYWTAKAKNATHKLLLQATPIFICWNLWKKRCACKYGGETININRVKYAIYKDNYKMLNTSVSQVNFPT